MKLSKYNNETTSYNYEIKLIRFHIFMKELFALLKKKFLPTVLRLNLFFIETNIVPKYSANFVLSPFIQKQAKRNTISKTGKLDQQVVHCSRPLLEN